MTTNGKPIRNEEDDLLWTANHVIDPVATHVLSARYFLAKGLTPILDPLLKVHEQQARAS